MGRRPVGLGVVVVVFLAVLLVPVLSGRRFGGTAVAVAIAAPPQVGDCLLHFPPDLWSPAGTDSPPEVVPCTMPHDGEVITQTATVGGVPTSRRGGGNVPDLAACASTAYWYLGIHPLDGAGERSVVLGSWWPGFAANFEVFRPGQLQLRIGQSWAACVLTSPHGSMTGGLAHLFGASVRPSPIALCTQNLTMVLYQSVSCDQPHEAEILGWRVAYAATMTQGSFEPSCTELAGRITGMADPTAQGALLVSVIILQSADGEAREGWGPGHAGPYRAACTISTRASRQLIGSLTGLGNAPLPWK